MQLSLFNQTISSQFSRTMKGTAKNPPEHQIRRLIKAHELYIQLGTLQGVSDRLNITRERVRQLLEKGQKQKLFKYVLTRDRKRKELALKVSKEDMLKEIRNLTNMFDVCTKLNIKPLEYYQLVKFYQIDKHEYLSDSRKRKHLTKYMNIVDVLGHHPSTTEMQSRSEWRYTSLAIQKIWGTTARFRSEFGIEKPIFKIHPNTVSAWRKGVEKSKMRKKQKIQQVLDLVCNENINSSKTISDRSNIPRQSVIMYLRDLLNQKKVKRVGNKRSYRYIQY